jgi:hypothetical protein
MVMDALAADGGVLGLEKTGVSLVPESFLAAYSRSKTFPLSARPSSSRRLTVLSIPNVVALS